MLVSLIEQHYKDNYRKLAKKMGFRAGTLWAGEDIVQTAYERALQYHRSCDPERFPQWFSTILNNALRDYKNEEKGYVQTDDDELEEPTTQGCPLYPEHILTEMYAMINKKSPVQKEVLSLHFKQDYSAIDISRMTSYSYSQCHQIIQRFRNEFKELYK